mmetsp:Transcript_42882/g.110629  ORF Transcript_42882/g.110629 Transcript_42882/m.110629 type:complete len:152 (+) Transcript_42882:6103-6558(+)
MRSGGTLNRIGEQGEKRILELLVFETREGKCLGVATIGIANIVQCFLRIEMLSPHFLCILSSKPPMTVLAGHEANESCFVPKVEKTKVGYPPICSAERWMANQYDFIFASVLCVWDGVPQERFALRNGCVCQSGKALLLKDGISLGQFLFW